MMGRLRVGGVRLVARLRVWGGCGLEDAFGCKLRVERAGVRVVCEAGVVGRGRKDGEQWVWMLAADEGLTADWMLLVGWGDLRVLLLLEERVKPGWGKLGHGGPVLT